MLKLKSKIRVILSIAILIAVSSISFVSAGVGPAIGPDCAELLQPFNPNGVYAPDGSDTSKYVANFSESDCKQHAPYPGPHLKISDQDAQNLYQLTADAIKDKIHGPWTDHFHFFHSNSTTDDFIYKTYIAEFEITVQSDSIANTDSNQLQCGVFDIQKPGTQTYNDFRSCKDGAYDQNVYGGTKLSRKNSKDKNGQNIIVLTWSFGTDNGSLKPWYPGITPNFDKGDPIEIFNFDTSSLDNRTFPMAVRLKANDMSPSLVWSGTTTSRALVKDAALPTKFAKNYQHKCTEPGYDKNTAWCALEPTDKSVYPNSPEIGQVVSNGKAVNYYWVPIGTVSTDWKTPTPPPPAEDCSSINVQPVGPLDENGLPRTFTTTAVTVGGLQLDYQWTADNNDTITFDKNLYSGNPFFATSQGPIFQAKTDVNKAKDLSKPITLTVTAVKKSDHTKIFTGKNNLCQKQIVINPVKIQPDCESIDVQPVGPLDENGLPTTFTATGKTVGGLQLDYQWTADEKNIITFNKNLYINNPFFVAGQGANFQSKTDVDKAKALSKPVTLTITAVDKNDHSKTFLGKNNSCQKQIVINPVKIQPDCESINVLPVGPLDENGLPTTFTATGKTVGGLQLDYQWTADEKNIITFNKNLYINNPFFVAGQGANFQSKTDVDKSKALSKPVTLTITAVDKNDHSKTFLGKNNSCQKTVVINPQQKTICSSVTIDNKPANGVINLNPGDPLSTVFNVTSDPAGLKYQWTTSTKDGLFDKNNAPPYTTANTKTSYDNAKPTDGMVITVQGIDDNGPSKKAECSDHETVKIASGCTALTVDPTGPLLESDLNLETAFTISSFSDVPLDYKWTIDPINPKDPVNNLMNFDSNPYNGVPYYDKDNQNKVVKINPGAKIQNPIKLHVVAVNKAHSKEYNVVCEKYVVITPKALKCDELIIKNKNNLAMPDSFNYGDQPTDGMTLDVKKDANYDLHYIWSTDNGELDNIPGKTTVSKANPTALTDLGSYDQSKSTLLKVIAYDNTDQPAGCFDQFTINPKQLPAQCDDSKFILNATDALPLQEGQGTIFHATGFKTDNSPVNTMNWSTNNGTLSPVGLPNGPAICGFWAPGQTIIGLPASCSVSFSGGPAGTTISVSSNPPENGNICKRSATVQSPPPGQTPYCQLTAPTTYSNNNQLCIYPQLHNANNPIQYIWQINGQQQPNLNINCAAVTLDQSAYVYVNGFENDCHGEHKPEIIPPPQTLLPPTIQKTVNGTHVATVSATTKTVNYKITFNAPSTTTFSNIQDDIGNGGIQGVVNPGKKSTNDRITFVQNSQHIFENGGEIYQCQGPNQNYAHCFQGEIGSNLTLYKVQGTIEISYQGRITGTAINTDSCKNGICQEVYPNNVYTNYTLYDLNGMPYASQDQLQSDALVQIFCQYILTRAAGDIFLENDLKAGIDINQCSNYKSSTGIIITPSPTPTLTTPSTGAGPAPEIFALSHEICSEGQAGTLAPSLTTYYGQGVSGLSSQICEIKLRPGSSWQKKTIANSIQENKTRIARWEPISGNQDLGNLLNSYKDQNVYHVKGNLTVSNSAVFTNGDGAKTFIVEDGDLIINSDITYDDKCNKATCSVRDMASVAFIVLNGNIVVDTNVTTMAGVYYVQSDDITKGQLQSANGESTKPLTIYGSVFGDIEKLFASRTYSGDPAADQGGIVIRFDERIILNTPPGLSDIIDLSQTQVAR